MKVSYITLDVVGHACPLCVHGYSRSTAGTLHIGVVIQTVVQLEEDEMLKVGSVIHEVSIVTSRYVESLTSLRFMAFCLAVSYTGVPVTME